MEQFLQVGAITSTHGIRGEVKVFPTTDDPARFKKLKKVILDTGKRQIDMEIQSVRFFKQFVIVKFKGIDNINDVEQYKGSSLFVSRENAVSLEENEYYIADLIEEDRDFPGVEELRDLVYNKELDKALLISFNNTIKFVIENNQLIHNRTVDARNYLIKNKIL